MGKEHSLPTSQKNQEEIEGSTELYCSLAPQERVG